MASTDAEEAPPPPEPPSSLLSPSHVSPSLPFTSPAAQPQENHDPERPHRRASPNPPRDRIILVNPLTQDMVVVDPSSTPPSSWDPLLRALQASKCSGRPAASRESVRAMRDVIGRRSERGREEEEEECVICMEEFEEGREMPCGHRFHGGCIERWLGIHGTCPVCRYQMPAEERAAARRRWEEDDQEGGEGGERRDIWISFSVRRRDSWSEIVHHHHHLHHHHFSTDRA